MCAGVPGFCGAVGSCVSCSGRDAPGFGQAQGWSTKVYGYYGYYGCRASGAVGFRAFRAGFRFMG